MRTQEILTGDSDGFGGDSYERHLRKFQRDAARAKEKMSSDNARTAHDSPCTPRPSTNDNGSTSQIPSPWKSPKSGPSGEHAGYDLLTPPATAQARHYGSFKRQNDDASSLESWEEKWYALGSPQASSSSTAKFQTGPGTPMASSILIPDEAAAGPGKSWQKLI
jgi:hypothetical protein